MEESIPILEILTFVVIVITAYAHGREGMFGAVIMLVNILLAGFLAFNFWETLIGLMGFSPGGALDHFADAILLMILFCVFLGALRLATLNLSPSEISIHPILRQAGGAFFGIINGYLLSGILICIFQTLPWHQNFLWYHPEKPLGLGAPDRVWLSMMRRASGQVFDYSSGDEQWFDADGSFILRYARYKRYTEARNYEPMPRQEEEFPVVLKTTLPATEP